MSTAAVLGTLYGVGFLISLGILSGWKGWEAPWPMASLVWPLAIVVCGIHLLTQRTIRAAELRRAQQEAQRQTEAQILREAGIEP